VFFFGDERHSLFCDPSLHYPDSDLINIANIDTEQNQQHNIKCETLTVDVGLIAFYGLYSYQFSVIKIIHLLIINL
jgi:hypothetical protein